MANSDTINLDFQVLTAGDPKVLMVLDTSTWGLIESEPAIFEITPPTTEKTFVTDVGKGRINLFNSSNLLISPVGQMNDLPDGIWKIIMKGSPSSLYCLERDYLKTDGISLELDKLYINLGFDESEETKRDRKALLEIESMIRAAEAYVRQGKSPQGADMFKRAAEQLVRYDDCENC